MGLDLYFYRCKKNYYEEHAHDLNALSHETLSADFRWMNLSHAKYGVPLITPPPAATDAYRCPKESDNVILVNGWLQHAGAAYRWLLEHTELTMEQNQPVKLNYEDVWSLYWACDAVLRLKPDEDGYIDGNICEQRLPAMDDSYFGTNEYCEEYQEEVAAVAETLNILLNTIDAKKEIVLVQASW